MPICKSVFNCDIIVGNSKVSEIYVGSDLVYKYTPNIFIFEITTVPTIIGLSDWLRGDVATNVITDWGDGTKDDSTRHEYNTPGRYQVVTRYGLTTLHQSGSVSCFGDSVNCLVEVLSINSSYTDCSCMFYNCKKLTNVSSGNNDMSKVTDMSFMFYDCNFNILNINSDNWNLCNLQTAKYMFSDSNSAS